MVLLVKKSINSAWTTFIETYFPKLDFSEPVKLDIVYNFIKLLNERFILKHVEEKNRDSNFWILLQNNYSFWVRILERTFSTKREDEVMFAQAFDGLVSVMTPEEVETTKIDNPEDGTYCVLLHDHDIVYFYDKDKKFIPGGKGKRVHSKGFGKVYEWNGQYHQYLYDGDEQWRVYVVNNMSKIVTDSLNDDSFVQQFLDADREPSSSRSSAVRYIRPKEEDDLNFGSLPSRLRRSRFETPKEDVERQQQSARSRRVSRIRGLGPSMSARYY